MSEWIFVAASQFGPPGRGLFGEAVLLPAVAGICAWACINAADVSGTTPRQFLLRTALLGVYLLACFCLLS